MSEDVDAVVVGSGPNGLVAAVTLARAGLAVRVYEAASAVGGGARTEELTLPGFRHDPCSAVHPLAAGSPALAELPLDEYGLEWSHPAVPLAHPLPDGTAAILSRSATDTAASLGADASAYRRLVTPFLGRWSALTSDLLRAPFAAPPRHPLLLAAFGVRAAPPAAWLASTVFRSEAGRALLAGLAAHAISPLSSVATSGVALLFALAAHEVGWPVARGGSQAISDALAGYLRALGGEIVTDYQVCHLAELPRARAYVLDVSPRELVSIAADALPASYVRGLRRYRYGPAAFKVDYALAGPVPWRAEAARQAGSVHLGPGYRDISAALSAVASGRLPERPFLITSQPTVADPSRAPAGRHVFWAYAHVPHGWRGNLTELIEDQVERFAPGFRDLVLARAVSGPAQLAARNRNYIGGDIGCGSFAGVQALARPTARAVPYATPSRAIYLCSAATPPGPGVHGMCGYHAARTALRRAFGLPTRGLP